MVKKKNPAAVALAKLRTASMTPEERSDVARKAGLASWPARRKKIPKKQRQEIARKAAAARWAKKAGREGPESR
jgi:hypothetical protein